MGGEHYLVGGLQVRYAECFLLCAHLLQTTIHWHCNDTQFHIIDGNLHRGASSCGKVYRYMAIGRGSRGGHVVRIAGTCLQFLGVIEVATSMEPGVVVDLIERAIVVSQGIVGFQEIVRAQHLGFVVVLGQEIIAVTGIRIAHALMVIVPSHRSDAIEQFSAIHLAGGQLHQVVRFHQIIRCQQLWLQTSTIAVDFHLTQIGESCTSDEVVSQLVDARLGDADLDPGAFSQYGVISIALRGISPTTPASSKALALDVEHEANQLLILSVAIDQGHERHIERTLLPRY